MSHKSAVVRFLMNRGDFQKLAKMKLEDAQAMLEKQRYSGAYYLCGYVIECALKACITKQTREYDFPPDPTAIRQIYVHDLVRLVKAAGLEVTLGRALKKDKRFEVNWGLVKEWNEITRYEEHSETKARSLYDAIVHKKDGVLQWIKQYW